MDTLAIPLRALTLVLLCAGASAVAADSPPKAPFRLLYSNDTTNITSCASPYHAPKQGITDDMIRATVDEAVGVDVHLLQPGMGWIPWWKSNIYPADEHYRYYQQKGVPGADRHPYAQYMLAGGDMVKTFVEHCRRKGITPFISLRLNDGHGLEHVGQADGMALHTVSRFYEDHYLQYRIGPDPNQWDQRVLNWAIPEVRRHKFAFIQELCENYDLDGFELDFMRHTSLFPLDKTTSQERREIVTEFVRDVRKLLDRTARPGRHRWLCARVPCKLAWHDRLGIDLPALVGAGLEMVNLSPHYFAQQDHDLPAVRKLVPGAAVYLEMCHTTMTGQSVAPGRYDSFLFRRTTDPQFYTTAHLAYQRGADGVSLFNFVYYRPHGAEGRGPFNEPPFHVLPHLRDPDWLAAQPQWYFLARAWNTPLPHRFVRGHSQTFSLDLAPTEKQQRDGLLRLMVDAAGERRWTVTINGISLERSPFVKKPLDFPYEDGFSESERYACFDCPRRLVHAGVNTIGITLAEGKPAKLEYLDLILP